MQENDSIRLKHILDAANEALNFSRGKEVDDLNKDHMLALALVRLFEIIGEATRGLSDDFRDANPEIPWRKMVGMRDRLIHGYFDIDVEVVWKTIVNDLPGLVSGLERIFSSHEE